MSPTRSELLEPLAALARARVPFVVVGVTGINFYAHDPSWVDLMTSGLGLSFDDLAADAVTFRLGELEVRVGRLEKLLRAKERAGRPKDVEFLRLYAARLREQAGES